MTRSEKIKKLANAIREYRGITWSQPGDAKVEWKYSPQPHALNRVKLWLDRLQLDAEAAVKAVDGFKTFTEFRAWIKSIETP